MKRFYEQAAAVPVEGGWRVELDGRPVRTQGARPQIVPSAALAEALAGEWGAQRGQIDPRSFPMRDLADFAIDAVAADREGTIATLLTYAETDTLCYRAEPGETLRRRQEALWEPILAAAEARYDIRFERVAGIVHRSQAAATLARLRAVLATHDDFTLAALRTLASLAASLVTALAAIEPGTDPEALWAAANLEEDFQAELWGADAEAEASRANRFAAFAAAMRFAELARG
ncbi:MAG: molecular chaperone [Novosphingobium sp.]|nr:molecular chaperone [Novosphingobium sp.]